MLTQRSPLVGAAGGEHLFSQMGCKNYSSASAPDRAGRRVKPRGGVTSILSGPDRGVCIRSARLWLDVAIATMPLDSAGRQGLLFQPRGKQPASYAAETGARLFSRSQFGERISEEPPNGTRVVRANC